MRLTKDQQYTIILDWLYQFDHPCFSVHDMEFLDYWNKTTQLSEITLRKRINELVNEGRLTKRRIHVENTAPGGIPKWFFVYD